MAYCRKCGAVIDDQAAFCPNCGVQQNEIVTTNKIHDSGSIGWAILAFLIPPVGFILWLAWMDVKPRCSRMCGRGLLTLIALIVLSFVFMFIVAATK